MEIGKPVKEVPGGWNTAGRWDEVRAAARAASPDWLPLTFEDQLKAERFANGSAGAFKRQGFRLSRRGNVVYVRYLDGVKPE